ncbi:MAG: enoyl-CoA hydratase-related protein [Rhodothermales bacterium]
MSDISEETALLRIEGPVAFITMNRPASYNSFNKSMAKAVQDHLQACHDNDAIRAVVLTGAGKAFCAGQDLVEVKDLDAEALYAIVEAYYNTIVKQIRNMPKPVLAAVNGVAAGAGANIALACDIVVASEKASFIQAFSKIGLIPDSGGTYTLPRLIGLQRATALMMLGEKVSAADAETMGMIYKHFTVDEFTGAVEKLAHQLGNMPTKGLAYTKALLNQTFQNDFEAQLALEGVYQKKAGQSADYKEGVAAFVEKRTPNFIGQ